MKFVFALVVVALCVMYIHAPGMEARPNSPIRQRLQKRGAEENGNAGEVPREHGTETAKQQTKEGSDEEAENSGEANMDSLTNGDGQNPDSSKRKKRAATNAKTVKLWPTNDICYKFSPDPSFGDKTKKVKSKTYTVREMVKDAAQEWNTKTGLNIHEGQAGHCIEVKVKDAAGFGGCWSWIGYQEGKTNEIVIEYPKCLTHGVILHEMGHAFGLVHEAKRNDRENSVTINEANINSNAVGEFVKDGNAEGIRSSYDDSSTYDFCSIMHYSAEAFSKNGKPTIDAKKKVEKETPDDLESCMGSQLGLSIRDGEGIAKLYGTLEEDQTKVQQVGCKYGGYLLKNDPVCRCSNLFTGNTCEKPKTEPASVDCGNTVIDLTDTSGVQSFKTPNYGGTNKYPVNSKCTWVFTLPKGQQNKQLCLAFPEGYDVEAPAKTGQCAFDWFELVLNELLTMKTKRYCGAHTGWYKALDTDFTALVFTSDEAYPAKGFEGKVAMIDKVAGQSSQDADAACKAKLAPSAATVKTKQDYQNGLVDTNNANNLYDYHYAY